LIGIDRIRAATARAAPHVLRSPLLPLDGSTRLKVECLQPTGSFKVRGFFARALQLSDEERAKGLLTVSAGNAAAACAYVAHRLGLRCRVVMYEEAPDAKKENVRRWGATPVFLTHDGVHAWLHDHGWEREPETFIHPFADPEVMAGHGGLALELLDQLPDIERVVIPVGGGGLAGGVASTFKALKPAVRIVAVQADGYPSMSRSLAAGSPVDLPAHTIADGTTAPVDPANLALLREVVDEWVTVPESRLKPKIGELALRAKVVAEGAGVLAYASLEQLEPGPVTVAVVSGGNLAPSLLAECLTTVTLPAGGEGRVGPAGGLSTPALGSPHE
jgi:threonine dehydratase